MTIQPASATLTIPGLRQGKLYTAVWWNPYALDLAGPMIGSESIIAQPDGTITLPISGLTRDVALKVFEPRTHYLPLVLGGHRGLVKASDPCLSKDN